ncbi:hypothetical protein Tco_0529507 [Tanacetum coccineum]
MISFRISISLAMCNPARRASYSASLLVVSNSNFNAYVYSFPYGLTTIIPALKSSELEGPSVNSFHAFLGYGSFLLTSSFFASLISGSGVFARKSANICPLIEFLPLNSISCSPNSMAHLAMRPNFSGFARICFMGFSLRTCISTALTVSSEVARYIVRVSSFVGMTIVDGTNTSGRVKFIAPWTVDITIPICCIAVLPSSRLCGESDFTIMNVSVFVTAMGPSPIVIPRVFLPRAMTVLMRSRQEKCLSPLEGI